MSCDAVTGTVSANAMGHSNAELALSGCPESPAVRWVGFGISLLTSHRLGAAPGRGHDLGRGQPFQRRHLQQPLHSWASPSALRSICSPSAADPVGGWPEEA